MEIGMYLLKVNIVLVALFGTYWLLLRNEPYFQLNRLILLSIVLLSFTLPILPQWQVPANSTGFVQRISQNITDISPFEDEVAGPIPAIEDSSEAADPSISSKALSDSTISRKTHWSELLNWGYFGILGLLFFSFLFQLIKLFAIQYERDHIPGDGYIQVQHDRNIPPFSFFKLLVINPKQYDNHKLEQIISHERIHIRQWHTFDILLVEITSMICWFNPIIWIFKRYVKLNLEYIADEAVLHTGIDKKAYQYHLLLTSANIPNYRLSNLFNSSPIKLRIKMMNSNQSSQSGLMKYTLILPIVLGLYMFVHPQLIQAQTPDQASGRKVVWAEDDDIYVEINPETERKTLEDISRKLSDHNIYFRIKNKNYNDGKLSSVRIELEIPNKMRRTTIEEEGEDGYFEPIVFIRENVGGQENLYFGKGLPDKLTDEGRKILTQNLETGMVIKRKKGGWHMTGAANF